MRVRGDRKKAPRTGITIKNDPNALTKDVLSNGADIKTVSSLLGQKA